MIINFWTYILIDLNLELFVKLIVYFSLLKRIKKDSEKKMENKIKKEGILSNIKNKINLFRIYFICSF